MQSMTMIIIENIDFLMECSFPSNRKVKVYLSTFSDVRIIGKWFDKLDYFEKSNGILLCKNSSDLSVFSIYGMFLKEIEEMNGIPILADFSYNFFENTPKTIDLVIPFLKDKRFSEEDSIDLQKYIIESI